jgi:hypothetical protein
VVRDGPGYSLAQTPSGPPCCAGRRVRWTALALFAAQFAVACLLADHLPPGRMGRGTLRPGRELRRAGHRGGCGHCNVCGDVA